MVWVRSEYAGELAVLSVWLSVFLPWNVTYSGDIPGLPGSILFLRFPFFEVQYAWGIPVEELNGFLVHGLYGAAARQSGEAVFVAYGSWIVGAALLGLAVLLSIGYYLREERLDASRADPVAAMGALLAGGGLAFLAANYLIVTRGIPGVPLPVGTVVMLALGGVLLTAERR